MNFIIKGRTRYPDLIFTILGHENQNYPVVLTQVETTCDALIAAINCYTPDIRADTEVCTYAFVFAGSPDPARNLWTGQGTCPPQCSNLP